MTTNRVSAFASDVLDEMLQNGIDAADFVEELFEQARSRAKSYRKDPDVSERAVIQMDVLVSALGSR